MAVLNFWHFFVVTFCFSRVCCAHQEWNSTEDWYKFVRFTKDFNKVYDNEEELHVRFAVFQASLQRQSILNRPYPPDKPVYGVNSFSDLTQDEFKERFLSPVAAEGRSIIHEALSSSPKDVPMAFDWRQHGKVTPVKNQGQCGSCWAFSVVEAVESRAAILGHPLTALSTQQVLSCDTAEPQEGCQGGLPEFAFGWLQKNAIPLTTEQDYPFESGDGQTYPCRQKKPPHGIVVDDYKSMQGLNETAMLKYVYGTPVSVAVNAISWQDYIGGVIQHHCSSAVLDHAVVAVGYNLTGEVPYWIIRNTWGTGWGMNGYVLLKYGENMCGVAERVVYPVALSKV